MNDDLIHSNKVNNDTKINDTNKFGKIKNILETKGIILIYVQIIYNLIIKYLISEFNFPSALNFVTDIINVFIVVFAVYAFFTKKELRQKIKSLKVPIIIFGLIIISTIVSLIVNQNVHIIRFVWAIRNNYRFLIFAFSAIILLDKKSIKGLFNIMQIMYILHLILVTVQFFIQGYKYDYVNGIFGTTMGNNILSLVFISCICMYTSLQYFDKRTNIFKFLAVVISSLYIAVLSELKVYYFMIVMLIVLALLLTKFEKKNLKILLILAVILFIFAMILGKVYPKFADFFTIEKITEYLTSDGYGSYSLGGLNRLNVFSVIDEYVLKDNLHKAFGVGLGNAEYSKGKEVLTSDVYNEFSDMNYVFFFHSFYYIENGWVGIILYYLLILSILVIAIRKYIKTRKAGEDNFYNAISVISILMYLILTIYSIGIRTEGAGYLIWLFMVLFLCDLKDKKDQVCVRGYADLNLGDDLFIKILSNRYNEKFVIKTNVKYPKNIFSKNVRCIYFYGQTFFIKVINKIFKIRDLIEYIIQNNSKITVRIGGSIFMECNALKFWKTSGVNMYKPNNKYYILGSNFGPYEHKEFEDIIEKGIISKAQDVCFRDKYSYQIFNKKNSKLPVRYASDIVFGLDTSKYEIKNKKQVVFSIIECEKKLVGQYKESYQNTIIELTKYFQNKGYQIIYMSFCKEEKDEVGIEEILEKIKNKDNIKTYYYKGNIDEALQIFADSQIVVGTRFHANIIGLLFNKTIIPIGYNHKTKNTLDDLNFKGMYIDITETNNFSIDKLTKEMLEYKLDISKEIKNSEKQFEKLDEVLNKN